MCKHTWPIKLILMIGCFFICCFLTIIFVLKEQHIYIHQMPLTAVWALICLLTITQAWKLCHEYIGACICLLPKDHKMVFRMIVDVKIYPRNVSYIHGRLHQPHIHTLPNPALDMQRLIIEVPCLHSLLLCNSH